MALTAEQRREIVQNPQSILNPRYGAAQEEEERVQAAGVRTATRTKREVVEPIRRRARRSGIEVTRPTENRFLTGANVTGVNELERNRGQ